MEENCSYKKARQKTKYLLESQPKNALSATLQVKGTDAQKSMAKYYLRRYFHSLSHS